MFHPSNEASVGTMRNLHARRCMKFFSRAVRIMVLTGSIQRDEESSVPGKSVSRGGTRKLDRQRAVGAIRRHDA